ncbi:hypothetical protein [Clostridium diolis]|uniref:hypothetical protein n=1 Tax=Clostridium diolis TaxID=223919 RepID=UPI003AF61FB8
MDITTVRKKLDNIILEVVRKVYGMEQEFWDTIHREDYYRELEKVFCNRIVRKI